MVYCFQNQKRGVKFSVQGRIRSNEYRTTIVCVDSCDGDVWTGRLYNPYLPDGEQFQSLMGFLRKMEDLLDGMQCPQPFTADRTFGTAPVSVGGRPADSEIREGRYATFAVRIIFRQNATWQGSVSWLETGQEERFRSALELLKIMDSAMSDEDGKRKKTRSCGA